MNDFYSGIYIIYICVCRNDIGLHDQHEPHIKMS